jgi:L-ascorbate metabolism protein UlaG (beta-lactamase superfamily)
MKIQFYGNQCFSITGKNAKIVFDPNESFKEKGFDFAMFSNTENADKFKAKDDFKKILKFPGEFEISEILLNGVYSRPENIIFKILIDNITFAHFGEIERMPDKQIFEKIGENIDVAFINLSKKCSKKLAKELLDTLDPRLVILGGNKEFFPKMIEIFGAKNKENPIEIKRSDLSDEKTEMIILG